MLFLSHILKCCLRNPWKYKYMYGKCILLLILTEVKNNSWKSIDFRKKISYFIFLSMLNCHWQWWLQVLFKKKKFPYNLYGFIWKPSLKTNRMKVWGTVNNLFNICRIVWKSFWKSPLHYISLHYFTYFLEAFNFT